MRDIHANLACVRSNTNFRKTKILKPKQLHLALVPLILNPNRPSRFDLHRHFFGIYRSSLPFTKQLIWVHMDQAAFGILSNSHPPMSSGIPSSAGFHGGSADCWVSLRFYGVVCRTRLRSRALLVENHNETGEISRATRDFVFHDNSQVAPQPTKRKMFVVLTKLFM